MYIIKDDISDAMKADEFYINDAISLCEPSITEYRRHIRNAMYLSLSPSFYLLK